MSELNVNEPVELADGEYEYMENGLSAQRQAGGTRRVFHCSAPQKICTQRWSRLRSIARMTTRSLTPL
jgi:hypothetical protein